MFYISVFKDAETVTPCSLLRASTKLGRELVEGRARQLGYVTRLIPPGSPELGPSKRPAWRNGR